MNPISKVVPFTSYGGVEGTPDLRTVEGPAQQTVYNFIRQAILANDYPSGSFIEEEEVSKRVGVSRTPVREAFQRLKAERYIDLVPRKGARVREATSEEVKGLFEARIMVEGAVIEHICRNRIPVPSALADIVERMRKIELVEPNIDRILFTELDWSFHTSIVGMCQNLVLAEAYKTMRSRHDRATRLVQLTPERHEIVYMEHVTMLGLLQAYDNDALQNLLRRHLHA